MKRLIIDGGNVTMWEDSQSEHVESFISSIWGDASVRDDEL